MSPDIVTWLGTLMVVVVMLQILRTDFQELKIRNISVMQLVICYLILMSGTDVMTVKSDLVAALILFAISFVMWMFRMIGAGDVKLYFVVGLLVGYDLLGPFAILLLVCSIGLLIAILLAKHNAAAAGISARFRVFGTEGKAPYAVPIALAALPLIIMRLVGSTG